jgi:hypothetical protein
MNVTELLGKGCCASESNGLSRRFCDDDDTCFSSISNIQRESCRQAQDRYLLAEECNLEVAGRRSCQKNKDCLCRTTDQVNPISSLDWTNLVKAQSSCSKVRAITTALQRMDLHSPRRRQLECQYREWLLRWFADGPDIPTHLRLECDAKVGHCQQLASSHADVGSRTCPQIWSGILSLAEYSPMVRVDLTTKQRKGGHQWLVALSP